MLDFLFSFLLQMRSANFSSRVVRRRFFTARQRGAALAESTRDGVLEFRLSRCQSGIYVERRQFRLGAGIATHAMCFGDEVSFLQWCEADALKFSYPLVYSSLKKHVCALLSDGLPTPPAA
jgi:hypothetical protein